MTGFYFQMTVIQETKKPLRGGLDIARNLGVPYRFLGLIVINIF
jgi:hypothetical protein